jgi:uncharacterized protein YjbI with pentapeptide repeats
VASRRARTTIAPAAPELPEDLESARIEPAAIESGTAWSRVRLDRQSATELAAPGLELEESRLERVDRGRLARLSLADVELDACSLANVDARSGAMMRALLVRCRLTGLSWTEGIMRDVVLRECRIDLASFAATRLEQVVFERCLLAQTEFQDARLRFVRFVDCDLSEVDLSGARFDDCELRGCAVDGVRGADRLRGVAMPWDDIVASAGMFADALGIRVLDDER